MTAQDTAIASKAAAPRAKLIIGACAAGLVTAVVFLLAPRLDIAAAGLFMLDTGGFVFNYPGIGAEIRTLFILLFWASIALALAGVVLALRGHRLFGIGFPRWFFLAACLAVGPGLTANVLLKDNWGRARPFHIEEFGGKQKFTPPLLRSDQCERNCSFVSGEASSIFMIFFALALMLPTVGGRLMVAGIVGGLAAGLVRMAQGGHFLSDVIFAGVFMALLAAGLHSLLFDAGGVGAAERGLRRLAGGRGKAER
ncbi:MAG: phosphatase PAP2 family protein [Hyphomicrobiales bacterium]